MQIHHYEWLLIAECSQQSLFLTIFLLPSHAQLQHFKWCAPWWNWMHCFLGFHLAKIMFGKKPAVQAVFYLRTGNFKFTKVQEVQKDKLQGRIDVPVQRWLTTSTGRPNPSGLRSTGSMVMRHDFSSPQLGSISFLMEDPQ